MQTSIKNTISQFFFSVCNTYYIAVQILVCIYYTIILPSPDTEESMQRQRYLKGKTLPC